MQPQGAPAVNLTFVPHLLPTVRGIHSTLYATLTQPGLDLQALFEERYQNEPFVDVLPKGQYPQTRTVRGTNLCRIAVSQPQGRDTVVVMVAEDNLTKGASGQAIQNMNIMLGLPETMGLNQPALLPRSSYEHGKSKGSKHYPMKVVAHRPLRDWSIRLGVALGFIAVVAGSYLQRQWHSSQLSEDLAQAQVALAQAQSSESQIRQQLANMEMGAEVDRKSSQDVRSEISALKEQVQLQQQQLSFYRSLMNPAEGKQGLAIGELEYTRGAEPQRYHYSLSAAAGQPRANQ